MWTAHFPRTYLAHFGVGFWRFLNPDSSPPDILNYDAVKNLGLVGSATGFGFPEISGLTYNNEGGMAGYLGHPKLRLSADRHRVDAPAV